MKEETNLVRAENIKGVIHLEPLRGPNGLSAYEIYVNNLSEGEMPLTEKEWLDSLKKVNYYEQYNQIYASVENNTTTIPILINAYNKTCLLDVYLNGLKLFNNEYSVNTDTKEITLEKPINKDQILQIVVTKAVLSTDEDFYLLKGEKGENGKDGIGVPNGGSAGQVLIKKSKTDYDCEWKDAIPTMTYDADTETLNITLGEN